MLDSARPAPIVESKVFPVFETKGELVRPSSAAFRVADIPQQAATDRFVEWLTNETITLETTTQSRAKVVLCGHSMGGLLIADAALGIAHSSAPQVSDNETTQTSQSHPMWPRIIALIAFDTPYLGLHPFVFKNGLTKYAGHVEVARNVVSGLGLGSAVYGLFGDSGKPSEEPSTTKEQARNVSNSSSRQKPTATTTSGWSFKTLASAAASAAVLTTASAAAYYRRQDLVGGWTWVTDHAVWLKNLWDSRGMRERLEGVKELESGSGSVDRIVFRK